jgi:hypothetical protein
MMIKVIEKHVSQFTKACHEKLELENARLSESYYYASLPLCVVDSIFSIGVRYSSVVNTVQRFCNFFDIEQYRIHGSDYPKKEQQLSVSDLNSQLIKYNEEYLANHVFVNRQRTSTRNGILKAQAVKEFLEVLENQSVDYFQDLHKVLNNENFEDQIKLIKGQSSGITLSYFYMLAGDDLLIKPDRMIHRFIEEVIGEKVNNQYAGELLKKSADTLRIEYEQITPRLLDHVIWNYQRSQ